MLLEVETHSNFGLSNVKFPLIIQIVFSDSGSFFKYSAKSALPNDFKFCMFLVEIIKIILIGLGLLIKFSCVECRVRESRVSTAPEFYF